MDLNDGTGMEGAGPMETVVIDILCPTKSNTTLSNKLVVKFESIPEHPSDVTETGVYITRAEIIRRSGHNTFVIGFHGSPGVHEIECTETHVKPELWDAINNSDYMTFQEGDTPCNPTQYTKVSGSPPLYPDILVQTGMSLCALITLGEFDFFKGRFCKCVMKCPPTFVHSPGTNLSPRVRPYKIARKKWV